LIPGGFTATAAATSGQQQRGGKGSRGEEA
jgi:hypothetical protein